MRLFPFLLVTGALLAQDRPQFVWRGEVDGTVILLVRGGRLTVQTIEGAPAASQEFHFYAPLPDSHQDARLEVREGRGYVHIIDQPRLENHYTLSISIEDRQPGNAPYSIALYWEKDQENRGGRSGKLAWNGRVDEEALISCKEKSCTSSASHGAPVVDEHFKFSRPLPHRDVDVSLASREGRGEIRLVEQPRERNNYTARVSIRDSQAGSGEYAFTLSWREPGSKEQALTPVAERAMIWRGVVEGQARITIHGGAAFSQGARVSGEHADFLRNLPASSDVVPAIKKLTGRGAVQIVEYPSEKNNYTLVFEISDTQSGSSTYEIELDW